MEDRHARLRGRAVFAKWVVASRDLYVAHSNDKRVDRLDALSCAQLRSSDGSCLSIHARVHGNAVDRTMCFQHACHTRRSRAPHVPHKVGGSVGADKCVRHNTDITLLHHALAPSALGTRAGSEPQRVGIWSCLKRGHSRVRARLSLLPMRRQAAICKPPGSSQPELCSSRPSSPPPRCRCATRRP